MANTKREKLFTEFPPVPTEKWEEVITADLKGADYERKLVWKTGEGFNVRPYYRAENLEGIKFLGSQAGEFPYVRGTRAHNRWRVHQTVSVVCPKEANAEALKILNAGVDSLGFCIASEAFTAADLDTLLGEICIPAVQLTFCGQKTADVAELVLAKIEKEGIAKEDLPYVWDRYYKVDKTHKRAVMGTGLGLSIVKNILELHHAGYGVVSEPGCGSTFWFELKIER